MVPEVIVEVPVLIGAPEGSTVPSKRHDKYF